VCIWLVDEMHVVNLPDIEATPIGHSWVFGYLIGMITWHWQWSPGPCHASASCLCTAWPHVEIAIKFITILRNSNGTPGAIKERSDWQQTASCAELASLWPDNGEFLQSIKTHVTFSEAEYAYRISFLSKRQHRWAK